MIEEIEKPAEVEDESAKATQLPIPQGWKILCAVPEVEDKFESGILKPDSLTKI